MSGVPLGLTTSGELEEEEGEGDEEDDGDVSGNPEAELEAIERELLANPVETGPLLVELPVTWDEVSWVTALHSLTKALPPAYL